jgi:hypothetical protein
VRESSQFLLFLKIGAYENHPGYQISSKEKNMVPKLGGSQQFENGQFSGLVFTSQISKISMFAFGKLI